VHGLRPLLAWILAILGATAAQAADRPNILFIFADDHAYQAIGAYGSNRNQTPNIDRIAREGMRFDRCVVTNSICGPSRACILTGKYSHLNGFYRNGNRFDGSQQTFPKLLQQVGYQTVVIGKWHLETDPTGFNHYEVLYDQGPYYRPPMNRNGERIVHEGYTTDVITDLALEWLKSGRDATRPFMLMCQHKAPHRNWLPPVRHLHTYDDVEMPEPDTLFDDYAGRARVAAEQEMTIARHMAPASDLILTPPPGNRDNWEHQQQLDNTLDRLTPEEREAFLAAYTPKNDQFYTENPQGAERTRWNYQRYIKNYLRCIAAVDENVGRVLDYLDEAGLAENTVVIYSSDQGFYLGEHGWYDKRWMYEESFRTPLLVRWPGKVAAGSVNADIVSNLDFAETFLEIAGVAVPGDMQGQSLVPILHGRTPEDWRRSFYYHYYEGPPAVHKVARHYGIATDRYKLIHYYQAGEWELFDRENDPLEVQSVYGRPEYADLQKELEVELARLRQELGVPDEDPF
jgi:arylsulfatase A-like enzyme